jgi:hypothetical protein
MARFASAAPLVAFLLACDNPVDPGRAKLATFTTPQYSAVTGSSGRLLGIVNGGFYPESQWRLVDVDPLTAAYTQIGPDIPGAGTWGIFAGTLAIENPGDRLFFVAGSFPPNLVSMRKQTGAVLAAVPFPAQPPFLLFWDRGAHRLLGLARTGAFPNTRLALVEVDLATAASTTISELAGSEGWGVAFGPRAFDPVGRRLFFVIFDPNTFTNRLITLDAQNGNIIGSAPLTGLFGGLLMEYEASTGRLLASTYLGNFGSGSESLVSIDPVSGAVTVIGALPASSSFFIAAGISAADDAGRFFLLGGTSVTRLIGLNTATGQIVSDAPLTGPFLGLLGWDEGSPDPFTQLHSLIDQLEHDGFLLSPLADVLRRSVDTAREAFQQDPNRARNALRTLANQIRAFQRAGPIPNDVATRLLEIVDLLQDQV